MACASIDGLECTLAGSLATIRGKGLMALINGPDPLLQIAPPAPHVAPAKKLGFISRASAQFARLDCVCESAEWRGRGKSSSPHSHLTTAGIFRIACRAPKIALSAMHDRLGRTLPLVT
jgi:hypothetical protein